MQAVMRIKYVNLNINNSYHLVTLSSLPKLNKFKNVLLIPFLTKILKDNFSELNQPGRYITTYITCSKTIP